MANNDSKTDLDISGNGEGNPVFSLERTYVKDISLEMPHAPEILLEQEVPTVEVGLNVDGKALPDHHFECSLTATVTTKVKDKTLYLVEVNQAGIFQIENIPDDQLDPLLGIVCPSMLFPYLRAHVADIINRTSLPPLHLADVNFQGLYEQRQLEEQDGKKAN